MRHTLPIMYLSAMLVHMKIGLKCLVCEYIFACLCLFICHICNRFIQDLIQMIRFLNYDAYVHIHVHVLVPHVHFHTP